MTSNEIPDSVYEAAWNAAFPGLPAGMDTAESVRRVRAAVNVAWPIAVAAGRAQAAKQMLVASALEPEPAIRRHLAFLAMKGNPLDVLTGDEAALLAQLTEPQP